jgi:outer membrane protein TolC
MRSIPFILFLLASTALHGQSSQDSARLDSLVRDGNLYLSLQDAISMALENNLDVELQRIGHEFAEADIQRARSGAPTRGVPFSIKEGPKSAGTSGADMLAPLLGPGSETNLSIAGQTQLSTGSPLPSLDPSFSGKLFRNHTTALQVNSFQAGTTALVSDINTWNFSLQKGFLIGGSLSADFDNSHRTINSPRYDLSSFNTTSFGISYTQPLLRGFGKALNSRFIRIAVNSRRQSDPVFQQQVISTTAAVVRLYWDLVALNGDVEARRQALQRAEKLLHDNEEQVEVGTRAPIEATRARAEVARSRRDLIAAESLVRQQETVLKDYLSHKTAGAPKLAGIRIVPTDPLRVDSKEPLPDLKTLADTALEVRPDIAAARVQIESTSLALTGSRNALKPSLDLVVSARNNGMAGDIIPLVLPGANPHNPDPILVGGYGSSLAQVFRRNFPDYGIGVQFTIPLQNQAAKADYARDSVALRQQELRLLQLRKQVHVEIQNALIALEQARAALESARQEREFQEQAFAAEEEKLAVGASTTYLVIQYQRDLAQARSAEIAAQAACAKAQAALDRASGRVLEPYAISINGTDAATK